MQFVANASHELRTPLATMRASLDVAMAKGGPVPAPMAVLDERLRRELDHVDRLLDSFLSLAQSGSVWLSLAQSGSVWRGVAGEEATVSLDEAVVAAIGNRSGAIWNRGLSVDQHLCRRAWALGSPTLLAHMVDNIVDRARPLAPLRFP
jgi:hypothetical protein